MIPIYKLDKLPRSQKLRKIAKYFTMAERRLSEHRAADKNTNKSENYTNIFSTDEIVFFIDAVRLLSKDEMFKKEARKIFEQAAEVFYKILNSNNEPAACYLLSVTCIRALNNVKHILLAETGKDQADWDFTVVNGTQLDSGKRRVFEGMQVYLEDIRSPFNVGAMFRTAESFGVEKIILSPFCADPRHRRAERTAMGCIDIVPWERKELFACEEFALQPGDESSSETEHPAVLSYPVFALETGGTPINEFAFPECGIMIAGSEELGVSPRALEAADASLGRVSIPIYGAKASLNVSTAFGIALHAWVLSYFNDKKNK